VGLDLGLVRNTQLSGSVGGPNKGHVARDSSRNRVQNPRFLHNILHRERPDEKLDDLKGIVTLEW
jgi:hypothetical protein